ncbi:hypothetical protein LV779_02185 [Streptomyces thinghirensis]|nr:hypothetical protein [Streptomyces thinghirensis]
MEGQSEGRRACGAGREGGRTGGADTVGVPGEQGLGSGRVVDRRTLSGGAEAPGGGGAQFVQFP